MNYEFDHSPGHRRLWQAAWIGIVLSFSVLIASWVMDLEPKQRQAIAQGIAPVAVVCGGMLWLLSSHAACVRRVHQAAVRHKTSQAISGAGAELLPGVFDPQQGNGPASGGMHTRLTPPSFGAYAVSVVLDAVLSVAGFVVPLVALVYRLPGSAWNGPEITPGFEFSLGMVLFVVGVAGMTAFELAYFLWLPTTRLGGRPGHWLCGLRMADLDGQPLQWRRLKSAIHFAEKPEYLVVQRIKDDKRQMELPEVEK